MKSYKNTHKYYLETLAELEKVENTCVLCGELKSKHIVREIPDQVVQLLCSDNLEYPIKFKLNDLGIVALQNRKKVFEWVLDQEETYLSMDDCIMPETEVATFSEVNKPQHFASPVALSVFVADLDEPYRTLLLNSSNKLAIQMPAPIQDTVQIVCFAIFPGGQIYRNWQYITEEVLQTKKDELVEFLRTRLNLELTQELKSRYGG